MIVNQNKLFLIKIAHTLIWAIFVGIIFYILYCGITGRVTIYTWIGIGIIVGEGLVLLLFKMYCPLTVLARRYSDSERHNFDIFLPEWLARYNKVIFTSLFLLGLALVLYQRFA
ncbi:hypothetical protein [Muriicola sp.]|uniref:hypothetical protein n=1 Tax=Muriicola sp. TaxID=2020856 RepID=UPI003562CA21